MSTYRTLAILIEDLQTELDTMRANAHDLSLDEIGSREHYDDIHYIMVRILKMRNILDAAHTTVTNANMYVARG